MLSFLDDLFYLQRSPFERIGAKRAKKAQALPKERKQALCEGSDAVAHSLLIKEEAECDHAKEVPAQLPEVCAVAKDCRVGGTKYAEKDVRYGAKGAPCGALKSLWDAGAFDLTRCEAQAASRAAQGKAGNIEGAIFFISGAKHRGCARDVHGIQDTEDDAEQKGVGKGPNEPRFRCLDVIRGVHLPKREKPPRRFSGVSVR